MATENEIYDLLNKIHNELDSIEEVYLSIDKGCFIFSDWKTKKYNPKNIKFLYSNNLDNSPNSIKAEFSSYQVTTAEYEIIGVKGSDKKTNIKIKIFSNIPFAEAIPEPSTPPQIPKNKKCPSAPKKYRTKNYTWTNQLGEVNSVNYSWINLEEEWNREKWNIFS